MARHGWGLTISCVVLLATGVACAAGLPDPAREASPPPSPRFAPPDSSVLFADDFSHGLGRWQADRTGVWSIVRGMLRADLPDAKQLRSLLFAGDPEWRDYAVDLDVCMMRGVDKGVIVRAEGNTGVGVDLRGGSYQDVTAYVREWPLGKASVVNANGVWHHIRVEAQGDVYRVYVNGVQLLTRTDRRRANGRIALPAYTGGVGQCTVYYDNVIVTSLADTVRTLPGRDPRAPEHEE